MRPALLLLLAACGAAPSPAERAERQFDEVDGFVAIAEESGWTVQEGALTFAELEFCCEPFVHCGGLDPATTVASYSLPKSPEQQATDPDLYWMWGGEPPFPTTRDTRMRPDEAFVWIGTAPPRADYFAVRTLLSTRDDGSGNRERVTGALGPPLNHEAIDRWNEPLAVVTSADFNVEKQVVDWLIGAGFDAGQVHTERIAAGVAILGLHEDADSLTTQVHVLGADPPSMVRWRSAPHRVFRMTPDEIAPAPIGTPVLTPRGTGDDESSLLGPLNELTLAVAANWEGSHLAIPMTMAWDWHPTFDCLGNLDCQGDTHDRLRAESEALRLDSGFFVLMGVQHVRQDKASAMTIAAHRALSGVGVAWMDASDLEGTAQTFLGDSHPRAEELYALVVARDCDAFLAPCIEVPSTCPGPAFGEDLYLSVSSYLEPRTGAAPLETELLVSRVLKFLPVAP